jgi:hypothetical protein
VTAQLDKALKRELLIGGAPYMVTIDPHGVKLVPKGKRKGFELAWESLISGDAALAAGLNAMLAAAPAPSAKQEQRKRSEPRTSK